MERDETLPLRDFPTLTHVIGWVREQDRDRRSRAPRRRRAVPRPALGWQPAAGAAAGAGRRRAGGMVRRW